MAKAKDDKVYVVYNHMFMVIGAGTLDKALEDAARRMSLSEADHTITLVSSYSLKAGTGVEWYCIKLRDSDGGGMEHSGLKPLPPKQLRKVNSLHHDNRIPYIEAAREAYKAAVKKEPTSNWTPIKTKFLTK